MSKEKEIKIEYPIYKGKFIFYFIFSIFLLITINVNRLVGVYGIVIYYTILVYSYNYLTIYFSF